MALITDSGRPVHVGPQLASGGQGEVLRVLDRPAFVFKRYFRQEITKDPTLERRLAAMTRRRPAQGGPDGSGHMALAWPAEAVRDGRTFVGFLMPIVDVSATVELHRIANPSERPANVAESWITGFTWGHRVSAAANLARATAVLHQGATVIGDFNERNIRVSRATLVTLLDCDSMQVTDPDTGERFFCRVGRPEYTAPELLGADWSRTVREPASDLFALAIHIYQLLMGGEHPFRGIWSGPHDKPASTELATRGIWAHGGGPLGPRPRAVAEWLLPPDVMTLFRRTFELGAHNPAARPTASEWDHALRVLIGSTRACAVTPMHAYPAGLRVCPWCDRDERARVAALNPTAPQSSAGVWAPSPAAAPTAQPVVQRSTPARYSPVQSTAGPGLVPGSPGSKRIAWIVAIAALLLLAVTCFGGNMLNSTDSSSPATYRTATP